MHSKQNNDNLKNNAKTSASVYDDALPKTLKARGSQNHSRVNLKTDSTGNMSPFIVHLSHQEESSKTNTHSNLEALAQSLIIDDTPENASESVQEESLLVDFQELANQLRDSDRNINEQPQLEEQKTAQTFDQSVPAFMQSESLSAQSIQEAVIETHNHTQETTAVIEIYETTDPIDDKETKDTSWSLTFLLPTWIGPKTRAIASFIFISFSLVLPLHAMQGFSSTRSMQTEITNVGKSAIDDFMRGASALEQDKFSLAQNDFERATKNFSQAQDSLENLHAIVAGVVNILPQTDKTYDSVRGLIDAGKELSQAAELLANAGDELSGKESMTLTTKLRILNTYIQEALPHVENATDSLKDVSEQVIPQEYQETVTELKTTAPSLAQSMNEFMRFSETLGIIMGADKKMRYLVTFQNNTELRATGGFIGSFAEMDLEGGDIVNMHIPEGGTYDLQGQLSEFVESPKPLSLIDPRWEFHDSNWFADFPTSAEKMIWFYEHAGGPTVDGILTFNATMIPELLEILGPVEMPEYGRTINSENFLFETQKIVEFEYEQYKDLALEREEEAPKQFIGDLAPKLLEKIEQADMPTMLAVLELVGGSLIEKDALVYFKDNQLQSDARALGWTGELKQTEGDYLMAVNTNLGGGKTDLIIDQQIDIRSNVDNDGSIINTVTITKEHRGIKNTLFEGVNNVDYFRLYVPKGSELLEATGFEIPSDELFEQSELPLKEDEDYTLISTNYSIHEPSETDIWEESGKTVFGNWIQTAPGETEIITFTYRLPIQLSSVDQESSLLDIAKSRLGFKDLESHTIFIQKQPGVISRINSLSVSLPNQKEVVWTSHLGTDDPSGAKLKNNQDHFVRILMENAIE
jgi:hypothetical protein